MSHQNGHRAMALTGDRCQRKRIEHEKSGGNVFADIGLPNAEEHLVKAKLVMKIDALMQARSPKQTEAASSSA